MAFNEVKPAVNQIETNVWDQKWSEDAFMKEIGIQHEAWAPFAEGNNDVFRTPLLQKIGENMENRWPGHAAVALTAGHCRHPQVGTKRTDAGKL